MNSEGNMIDGSCRGSASRVPLATKTARCFSYDFVRAVAMVFVVGVHARSVFVDMGAFESVAYLAVTAVVFTCNPIFFMLSGRFTVRAASSRKDLLDWYVRRVTGLFIPVAVYFLLRTLYDSRSGFNGLGQLFKAFVRNSLSGFASTEYWFLYSLAALLVVAPFLAKMLDSMTDYECKVLVVVCLVFNGIQTIFANAGVSFSWAFIFKDYAIYYLLGAILPRLGLTDHQKKLLKLLGIVGLVGTIAVSLLGLTERAYDTSPLFSLASVGMFYLLHDAGESIGANSIISFVAKHSLGVYMVHMILLQLIAPLVESIPIGSSHFLEYGLTVFICVALSIAVSFVVDIFVVRPLQNLFGVAFRKLSSTK